MNRLILLCVAALLFSESVQAQVQLGHKLLGGVGIDAGVQPDPGLYIAARFARFAADELNDREGRSLPIALDLDAWGGALGIAYTVKPKGAPHLTFALSAPFAHLSLRIDDPRVSLDRAGLGDLYLLPLKVGWRSRHADGVASYALYAPTGKFEGRSGGIGRGHWTQQLSLGGAAYFTDDRRSRASVLMSYDRNSRKRGIDITRGSTVQLQGGAGVGIGRVGTAGIAAYALRQLSDDRGADLPDAVRGARDRVFGLGPEVQLVLPRLRLKAELRLMFDLDVRARPVGSVLSGGITHRASVYQRS